MKFQEEKRFYIGFDSIKICYPCEVSKRVKSFGVLQQYKNKKYTLKEINEIIAELILKQPYVNGSMSLKVCIYNGMGYHHILDFKNYWYKEENRTDDEAISFREIS